MLCCCCCTTYTAGTACAPSPFNDVFGFFIWSTGTPQNIALLPNSTSPVSISTVNACNDTYYVNNDYYLPLASQNELELNGFTTLLKTADYVVTAGVTYHVKLAVADGFDHGVDSVVWVKAGSVRFNIKDCVGSWIPNGACSGKETRFQSSKVLGERLANVAAYAALCIQRHQRC